jgi:ATPase family associated with various cellular activities (AAA)
MWNFNVGLGKTTLAHVAAQHCGYQPYEINASDDRTAASLVARIQVQRALTYYMQHTDGYTVFTTAPATCHVAIANSTLVVAALQDAAQMQSVMGSRKPNCIIVDEVDGTAGDKCTKHKPNDIAIPSVSYLMQAGSPPLWSDVRFIRSGGSDSKNAVQALLKLVYGGAGVASHRRSIDSHKSNVVTDEPPVVPGKIIMYILNHRSWHVSKACPMPQGLRRRSAQQLRAARSAGGRGSWHDLSSASATTCMRPSCGRCVRGPQSSNSNSLRYVVNATLYKPKLPVQQRVHY